MRRSRALIGFLVYDNYDALLDYNCAHAYALSVGLLADRIAKLICDLSQVGRPKADLPVDDKAVFRALGDIYRGMHFQVKLPPSESFLARPGCIKNECKKL